MTTIEQKRVEYLTSKHAGEEKYTAEKVEFLVRTGLTFDPTTKKKFNGEEKAYKDIDWYYPKGAAFKTSSDDSSDDPTPTPGPNPDDQNTPPAPKKEATLDTSNKTDEEIKEMLAPYGILQDDATAADAAAAVAAVDTDHDSKVDIVLKPVQDDEGKYMIDSDGNYVTAYSLEEDTED